MKSPQKDLCTSIFPSSTQEHFQFGSTFCNHSLPFGSDKATAASCTLKSRMKHGKNFATAIVLSQLDGICTMKKKKKRIFTSGFFSVENCFHFACNRGRVSQIIQSKRWWLMSPCMAKKQTKQNWLLRLNVTDMWINQKWLKSPMVKVALTTAKRVTLGRKTKPTQPILNGWMR